MKPDRAGYSLRFWEACTVGEKRVLLAGLRYAVGASVLLVMGYAWLEKWHLQQTVSIPGIHMTWIAAPIQETRPMLLLVGFILFYNTAAALLMERIGILLLAVTLSLLDLASALAGMAFSLHTMDSSMFSAIFVTMLLANLLFLGLPTLAVLFGRRASLLAVVFFFLADAYLYLLQPDAAARIPVVVTFTPMAFFTLLTYIVGHVSEVQQAYQRRAEVLGLQEKALRLEREALVDELERANDLKRQFLAFASHELRTPLHAMKGYTSCLLEGMDGTLNGDQAKDVEKIASNSDYLLSLINDFLDLTRIESGKLDLNPEEISIEACVREALEAARPLCREKNLFLKTEVAGDLPPVEADYVRLKQVFLNLLGNAVKFTEKGGITVSAFRDKEEVCVRVSDTGTGIPAEVLPRIFDAYRQWNVSASRRYGGSGLGLAIARRLVEMQRGKIEAESRVGEGSVFTVRLPITGSSSRI